MDLNKNKSFHGMKHYTNTRIFYVEGTQFDWSFIFNMKMRQKAIEKMHLKTKCFV